MKISSIDFRVRERDHVNFHKWLLLRGLDYPVVRDFG
jgi:hypothetical protein